MGCEHAIVLLSLFSLVASQYEPAAHYAGEREPTELEQELYLERVGISPEQIRALQRFDRLSKERARQAQYEQDLEMLENMEPNRVQAPVDKTIHEEVVQIPGERPRTNDTYLCSAYKQTNQHYIVGFEPLADHHHIHHIILFGCESPGIDHPVPAWDCGEMSSTGTGQYPKAPPCAAHPHIIYAWAKGAPKLDLPEGVAFQAGPNTENQFLVVQVHYMHEMDNDDFSGVKLHYTEMPQPRTAATLLVVTGGVLPPKSTEAFEAACVVDEPVEVHPFAYRVHTHRHGQRVSGYVVQEDATSGQDQWFMIGERDPQLEQSFEPVKNTSLVVKQNDILAARCILKNDEDKVIRMGPTGEDEMCNFYLMYWVEGVNTLSDNTCFSPGAPYYKWSREAGLNNIPK